MKRHLLVVNSDGQVRTSFIPFCAEYGDNWCISFCHCAAAAIDVCKANKVDAVISDVNEDKFSVIKFLADLKEQSPDTLRSIYLEKNQFSKYLNSIGLVNAFVDKESSHGELDNILERSISLHHMLNEQDKTCLISAKDLPSIPSTYAKLLKLLNQENTGMNEVAQLIERDPAMTAKVLQIVNSSFFALRREINSAKDAVIFLGLETLKGLVMSQQLFRRFANKGIAENLLDELWNHSLLTAYIARHIVRLENGSRYDMDAAFTAGILHDVGKLLMLEQLPPTYYQYASSIVRDNQESIKVEKMIFNTSHSALGASLLRKWGLSDFLLEPIAHHHRPLWYHNRFSNVIAVHVADCLAHEFVDKDIDSLRMDPAALRTANVLLDTRHWREECKKNFV